MTPSPFAQAAARKLDPEAEEPVEESPPEETKRRSRRTKVQIAVDKALEESEEQIAAAEEPMFGPRPDEKVTVMFDGKKAEATWEGAIELLDKGLVQLSDDDPDDLRGAYQKIIEDRTKDEAGTPEPAASRNGPTPDAEKTLDELSEKRDPGTPKLDDPAPPSQSPAPASSEPFVTAAATPPPDWPEATGGLWKVTAGYSEKIGLPDYSSISIGPVSVSGFVAMENVDEGLDFARAACERVMSQERARVDSEFKKGDSTS